MAEYPVTFAEDDNMDAEIVGASVKAFKSRITRCQRKRRILLDDWRENIDRRRGKWNPNDSDDARMPANVDWPMTKAKTAQLFSQVPKVIATADNPDYKPAAPIFEKRLNMRFQKGGIGAVMFEAMPDVVNASGIAAAIVRYESRSEMREAPVVPDEELSTIDSTLIAIGLKQREMEMRPFIVDRRFSVDRISPEDLLWDVDFVGSDFNRSPWLGREGRMTWAEAQAAFVDETGNPLISDDLKDKVLGDNKGVQDRLVLDHDKDHTRERDTICYQELYYWRHLYHAEEKYFAAIHKLVFVDGMDKPVVNEPWTGQRFDDELGTYVGACQFPIQVLTLDYMTDEAIPPSSSAIARPATDDKNQSRQDMFEHRRLNKPIRWFDSNRIDPDFQTALMLGDWSGFLPTQGPGDKAIGEVARSNYPHENDMLDRAIDRDLQEAWSLGPNQQGTLATGERSASEANITEGHFQTRLGMERARTVEFFLGLASVMAGLIALYDDFDLPDLSEEDRERLYMWDRERINHELAFTIRGDSTVLLTAEQRIQRIERFLNMAGKSGYVAPKTLLEEYASLSGLDPADVITDPPEPKPEPAKISLALKAIDLANPMVVATLLENGQMPGPEAMAAAKKVIAASGTTVKMTLGTDKDEAEFSTTEDGEEPPIPGGADDDGGGPPPMGDDRPDWQSVDRINSRRDASQN